MSDRRRSTGEPSSRRLGHVAAFAGDVAVVAAFVLIGRRSHDEAGSIAGFVGTAAPFLVALATIWLGALALDAAQHRPRAALMQQAERGVAIGIGTAALGGLLRRSLWDESTALSFLVVALVFCAAAMGGWRFVASRSRRPGHRSSSRAERKRSPYRGDRRSRTAGRLDMSAPPRGSADYSTKRQPEPVSIRPDNIGSPAS